MVLRGQVTGYEPTTGFVPLDGKIAATPKLEFHACKASSSCSICDCPKQ